MTRLRVSILTLGLMALATGNANSGWRAFSKGVRGSRNGNVSVSAGGEFTDGSDGLEINRTNPYTLRQSQMIAFISQSKNASKG